MKIGIYTVTMGRDLYLKRLVNSIIKNINTPHQIGHHIAFNGYDPGDEMTEWLMNRAKNIMEFRPEKDWNNFVIYYQVWPKRLDAGAANNSILYTMGDYDLCIKADDDCLWVSENYLDHVVEIWRLFSNENVSFSPFPVGLINNLGGPRSDNRMVMYGENTDTYYTFREVDHIGGFARITPTAFLRSHTWAETSNSEDVEFSYYCREKKVPMYYLENSLIVEHQESTLGQHQRYSEYFDKKGYK